MITVDTLLIELFRQGIETLSNKISVRDKKVLISLAKQINSGHFLTENQSKLLVKIFKENREHIFSGLPEQQAAIENPTWSSAFRVLDQIRKIFLVKEGDGRIIVEFTYNKRLKQQISELNKLLEGQLLSLNAKQYSLPLTEKNLHLSITMFKPFKFDIDQQLMKFYEEIDEIYKNSAEYFNVFELTNEKLVSAIKNDIGNITDDNLILLNDRRLKYQYSIFQKNPEISLKSSLANRNSSRLWIDSSITTLDALVDALQSLDRLPALLVFNGHESAECVQHLKKVAKSLENNNITDSIGVYFRFDSVSNTNKEFNSLVAQLGYNAKLDSRTKIAAIANNKLPKFMLKSGWYPKSVITFSNNFKGNKTSVYCDAVDLIVYYNDKRPLGGADAVM